MTSHRLIKILEGTNSTEKSMQKQMYNVAFHTQTEYTANDMTDDIKKLNAAFIQLTARG